MSTSVTLEVISKVDFEFAGCRTGNHKRKKQMLFGTPVAVLLPLAGASRLFP